MVETSTEQFRSDTDLAWLIYRDMLRTRLFEDRCVQCYQEGMVQGAVYPSGGQEAIGVGACHALEKGDWVIPSLRTRGAFFARGLSTVEQFRALLGSPKANNAFREPPHHSSSPEYGLVPGSAMIGGHLPVAAGLALSAKLDKRKAVALAFMGDGTLGAGDFYETANIAAVWKLPLIIVCENNRWQIMVPWYRVRVHEETVEYAQTFGLQARQVDGNDALDVYHSTRWAREQALSGQPVYLDCATFRTAIYSTHFGEPRRKKPPNILEWKKRDPVDRMAEWLLSHGIATTDRLSTLRGEVELEIEESLKIVLSEIRSSIREGSL
jgi:TPP-dependent pyruvate/acetoin dehydrogenase alpha subunit